jgi:hypothetical protein
VVYDTDDNAVVHFERTPEANQITRVYETSAKFGHAMVRAMAGPDEAMLRALENKGVYVDRIPFDRQDRAAAYENLGMLISNRAITYPDYPELMAELDVFKSDFTYGESPDYSLQVAQQSGILALCLVTYDVDPEEFNTPIEVFYSHDYDRFLYGHSGWW